MKQKVVIQTYQPRLRVVVVAAILVVAAVSGWLLYNWARSDALFDWRTAQEKHAQMQEVQRDLAAQIEALNKKNTQLREERVYLERSIDIDRQACATVKSSLKSLQSDLSDAREQLAFYRGIVSPKQAHAGVRVYDITVRPSESGDTYLFDLVLIQSVRHDRKISGNLGVWISGLQDGKAVELPLGSISLPRNPDLRFSFKYFQEFTGQVRLPENFRPQRVRVGLTVRGGQANAVEKTYDWTDLLRG